MYGHNILDNNPNYPWIISPPEWITFYDPVSPENSTEQALSIELQTLTRRTAPSGLFRDYPLEYKTFIPYDNGPTPVPGDVCGVFPQLSSIWYGGDYQTFAYTGTHRVQETAVVVPYQSWLASGLRSVAAPHAGLSTAYAHWYSTCFPAHEVWTENHKLYSEFPASVYNIVPCLTTLGLQPIVPSSGTIQY